jgi:uncharacterized membrane protein YphA (DoxX/SURF4 family)
MAPAGTFSKTIACARIAVAILFLLFGEYKLANGVFAHTGFPEYLKEFVESDAIRFYAKFLAAVVQPHAAFFGYAVGVLESAIGLSMLLGLWVRPMSAAGVLFMVNMILCTWWAPGHGVATWRYFGAELDHIPLLLLFLIFFAADAGTTWGLDGVRHRRTAV